jgi:hypothetical protein
MYSKIKITREKIDTYIRKWKDSPCSWISWINIVKDYLTKSNLYTFNAIPNKIPVMFFTELEKSILNLYGSTKDRE